MNDDLDADLLAGDRSRPGWRRRAVGRPPQDALAQLPVRGLLQTSMPITPFRQLQAHIKASGLTQAEWLRDAVIDQYLDQGGDPQVAAAIEQRPHRP